MSFVDGALFGMFGCLLYQLVTAYHYRGNKRKWPWQDKKSAATIPYFIFGVIVKLSAAAGLCGMLVLTEQISGAWAAFVAGMIAEHALLRVGDSALKEVAKR